ncbi:MAG: M20/M25/M40 family metallo-hydrolase [Phycisphaeraceae bacterium]|nr:M20/M25/M40 family metallo-hydrolase [Phycisphaeraceae bacterium]
MISTETPQSVDQLLQRMVQINSVNTESSGNPQAEAELGAYLEQVHRGWGFPTRRLSVPGRADNVLATLSVGSDKPWILFISHMDTVSVAGMTIDPVGGQIVGNRLLGRGATDTKGTGAAILWAMRQYAQGKDQPNNIAMVHTVDEESGMLGVRTLVKDHWGKLGFKPRGVIVGEPTELKPIVAHNGVVRMRVTTRGVAAHSSTPSRGRNAISMMSFVIRAIEDEYIAKLSATHPLTGKAVCSVTVIRGGSQINIIPDHCAIDMDRRLVPGESPTDAMAAVRAVLDGLAKRQPLVQAVELEAVTILPPLTPDSSQSFLPVVQSVLTAMNLPIQPVGGPYATEAGDLSHAGISALVIGPGEAGQAHTKDESANLAELHKGVELYLGLMKADWRKV